VTDSSRLTSRAQLEQELAAARLRVQALEAQLCQLSEQRDQLLHELNHRVGNNLAVLLGILDRQHAAPQGEVISAAASRISRCIQGLAVVQRMLSEAGWRPLCLATLCRSVLESVVAGVKPVARVRVADSTIEVSSRIADRIAVVLSELALNSLRHCWGREVIEIEVQLRARAGQLLLEYRDNGPGYPAQVLAQSPAAGGLGLLSELVSQGLDGALAFSNASGAVATLTFRASVGAHGCAGAPPAVTACNGGMK
jgi:two-component sensor histidine kinase